MTETTTHNLIEKVTITVKIDSDKHVKNWWFARCTIQGEKFESSADNIADAISGLADMLEERLGYIN